MGRLVKRNVWDFNKIFESVNGVKPTMNGNTSNDKPIPDITDIDGVKMPIAPSTLSGDLKEGELDYANVSDASPDSNEYVIGEGTEGRRKVYAKNLQKGDLILGAFGDMEVVQPAAALVNTPTGKVELVVKYLNGKLVQKIWNANTIIAVKDSTTPLPPTTVEPTNGIQPPVQLTLKEMFGDVNGSMDTVGLGEAIGFDKTDGNTATYDTSYKNVDDVDRTPMI